MIYEGQTDYRARCGDSAVCGRCSARWRLRNLDHSGKCQEVSSQASNRALAWPLGYCSASGPRILAHGQVSGSLGSDTACQICARILRKLHV